VHRLRCLPEEFEPDSSASASYIAAPAAVSVALPQASPTIALMSSIGITFPFNLILGIPFYFKLAVLMG
jgi:hypothetical protein